MAGKFKCGLKFFKKFLFSKNPPLQNCPCIKSIQFNDNIECEENLTNDFVTETTKHLNVIVSWQEKENWTLTGMAKQWRVEKYLKDHETSMFEKYMELKTEFVKWCKINDMERMIKNGF